MSVFSENTPKFTTRMIIILLSVSGVSCLAGLIVGNRAFLLIEKCQICYRVLDFF